VENHLQTSNFGRIARDGQVWVNSLSSKSAVQSAGLERSLYLLSVGKPSQWGIYAWSPSCSSAPGVQGSRALTNLPLALRTGYISSAVPRGTELSQKGLKRSDQPITHRPHPRGRRGRHDARRRPNREAEANGYSDRVPVDDPNGSSVSVTHRGWDFHRHPTVPFEALARGSVWVTREQLRTPDPLTSIHH
jgi:hypothetical protein